MKKVLFADAFNFKEKNFPNLLSYLNQFEVQLSHDTNYDGLKKDSGTLNQFDESLYGGLKNTHELSDKEIELLIHDEVMFIISSQDDFVEKNIKKPLDIYQCEYQHIVDIARKRAIFWYSYWMENVNADICVVFGGNTIYTKALMMVSKRKNIPCYVVEHSFTGNDYYFSMQYEALPNNINVDNKNILKSDWVTRYKNKNNKNVSPVLLDSKINFPDYILILCQVRNDYSVISGNNKYLNTVIFYKDLIDKLLHITNDNIVVKCHPFEDKKIKGILTYDYLINYVSTLSRENRKRIKIIKDFQFEALICDSKFAITLTSQSGLEVLASNKSLITFGDAFYSKKGFTYDVDNINNLTSDFLKDIPNYLDFYKYDLFYKYISNYFDLLVSSDNLEKISSELNLKKNTTITKNNVYKTNEVVVKKDSIVNSNVIPNNKSSNFENNKIDKGKLIRLSKKLRKDPKLFFEDSKNPIIKKISNLFN